MNAASAAHRLHRYPLHVYIAVLFTELVLTTGALIAAVDYTYARRLAFDVVGQLFKRSAQQTLSELRAGLEPIRTLVALLAQRENVSDSGPQGQVTRLPMIRLALDMTPMLSANYVSFAVGLLADYVRMGHLDRDLFELFLHTGVHLRFARRFLDEPQIDQVDIEVARQRARQRA